MVNLITSLLLIFGVGFSSANMDHESNNHNEPLKAIEKVNGKYALEGKFTIFDDGETNYESYSPWFSGDNSINVDFAHSYIFTIKPGGYITSDLGHIYQEDIESEYESYSIVGTNQKQYQNIKIEVYFTPNIPGVQLGSTHIKFSGYNYSNSWYTFLDLNINDSSESIIGNSKYIYCHDCLLTSVEYASGLTDEYKAYADSETAILSLNLFITENVINSTQNPYFTQFIDNGGYYYFSTDFNPWKAIIANSNNNVAFSFGRPNETQYVGSKNYYLVNSTSEPLSDSQYFYNYSGTNGNHALKPVDIFEGYFRYGASYYTNIRLYFDVQFISTGQDIFHVEYSLSSFVYASFLNTQTHDESIFLTTIKYQWKNLIGVANEYYDIGVYNPNLTPLENYEGWSSYQGLVQFTDLHWNYIPTIEFIYSLNRPSNTYGLKSGSSFYNLLGFTPSSEPIDDSNTGNNLLNVFGLVRMGWNGIFPILSMEILPGLYLGTLIFIPFVFMIIFAIIKLFKR